MKIAVWCLGLLGCLMSLNGYANHAETEPSDGTVNSFIPVDPPRGVEPVKLVRNASEALDMSAFRGKVVLLNIWATWCPPCLRELPALDRLQARQGDKDFEVVAVAVDRAGLEAIQGFYDRLQIRNLTLYHSTAEEFGRAYPVDVFPASFFLDREGRVLSFMRSLADWDDPAADRLIESYKAR